MLSKEIWDIMNREAQEVIEGDNLLKEILNKSILRHDSFSEALSDLFAKVRPAIIRALLLSLMLLSSSFNRLAALIRFSFSLGGHAKVRSLPNILSDTFSTLVISYLS